MGEIWKGTLELKAMKRRISSQPQGPRRNHKKIRVPKITVTTGAKLNKTSQSLIYRCLNNRGETSRRATNRSLNLVRDVTEIIFDVTPTEDTVWKSMRHKGRTKKIRLPLEARTRNLQTRKFLEQHSQV